MLPAADSPKAPDRDTASQSMLFDRARVIGSCPLRALQVLCSPIPLPSPLGLSRECFDQVRPAIEGPGRLIGRVFRRICQPDPQSPRTGAFR
jgi:hypothetical protein